MSKAYLVTGANSGLGLDATRQLALREDTKEVYMAARSKEKFNAAVNTLAETHDVPREKLSYVHFDACQYRTTLRKDFETIPKETKFDGVIFNAGGPIADMVGKAKEPNGVNEISQVNLLAHVQVLDYLVESGRMGDGSSLVISGSEAARGIQKFGTYIWDKPHLLSDNADDMKKILTGEAYETYNQKIAYSNTKGILALYFAAWATRHPRITVFTVSPGSCSGTNVFTQHNLPWIVPMQVAKTIVWIAERFGKVQSVEAGAKRYVDGILVQEEFKDFSSGAFVASAEEYTIGRPLVDQSTFEDGEIYADKKVQEAAYEAVREFA